MRIGHSVVKRASRAATAIVKVDDSTDYVNVLRDICSQSQIIEAWLIVCEGKRGDGTMETLMTLLHRVIEFLQVVFCAVVLYDMKAVLGRYIKHTSRAVVSTV